jgi:hypothetical protein
VVRSNGARLPLRWWGLLGGEEEVSKKGGRCWSWVVRSALLQVSHSLSLCVYVCMHMYLCIYVCSARTVFLVLGGGERLAALVHVQVHEGLHQPGRKWRGRCGVSCCWRDGKAKR